MRAIFVSRKRERERERIHRMIRVAENMFRVVQLVCLYSHMLAPAGATAAAQLKSVAAMTQKVLLCSNSKVTHSRRPAPGSVRTRRSTTRRT